MAMPGVLQKMPKEAPGVENELFWLQIEMSQDAATCKPAARKTKKSWRVHHGSDSNSPAANPSILETTGSGELTIAVISS